MKKSTLITTIAMIVVVVVALSTATYAWFSSTSTAIANTAFTTEVSGDWTIMLGTVDGSELNELGYAGSASDTIDLTQAGVITNINTGLWCPTGEISTSIASSAASTTLANRANFVQAEKTGANYNIKKLQTPKMNGTTKVDNTGIIKPFALRLVNVSGTTQTLQLNITVNAKSTGTTNSMYAAAAVRFYVYEVTNRAAETATSGVYEGTAYTSGYNYTNTAGVDALESITGTISQAANAINKSNNLKTITSYDDDTPVYTNVTMANYNVGDISDQFRTASANPDASLTAIGIEANDKYITYSFDLSEYQANDFGNIIIYTWIDGWVANASASQASFTVNYGFVSNPVYKAKHAA